jgi:phosphate butyryltransferase
MFTSISDLYKINKEQKAKLMVVANAVDEHSLDAVFKAKSQNIIFPILTGDKEKIKQMCDANGYDLTGIEVIHATDENKAVAESVNMVRNGKAEILMKGNVSTAGLLKGVLNETGGLKTGNLLSHFSIFELPQYHKLISVTDVAMNIAPTLKEKIGILTNALSYMKKMGYEKPKVAVIGAVETVNEKMPATMEAAVLSKMAQRKQLPPCLVDGPLALDNAMSKESAQIKGIVSDVAGDADLLLMPDIEAGNVLYKAFGFMGGKLAAVILGASAPIILTSRADSEESKLNSILLAALN